MTPRPVKPDLTGLAGGHAPDNEWGLVTFDQLAADLSGFLAVAVTRTGSEARAAGGAGAPAPGIPGPPPRAHADALPSFGAAEPLATIEGSVPPDTLPAGGVTTYGNTFKLHSLPASSYKVYLDFDGFTTAGTAWNSYWNSPSFYSKAFSLDASESFSATELLRIQQIWQRVAEYFAPFNIDVTTEDPGAAALSYTGAGDTAYGVRAVITDEDGKNFGGIGFIGSFTWSSDTPVYAYANRLTDSVKAIADATAHEVGHALGLDHDGRTVGTTTSEYYYGHGSGTTSWAPLMGVGYNSTVVQWSNGGYNGATTTEDDLSIITTWNGGVTWRADDWGNTAATAGALGGSVAGGVATVQTYGVISGSGARNDVDMFSFDVAAGGSIDLGVSAWTQAHVTGSSTPVQVASPFGMLDVGLTLLDGALRTVATWDDAARTDGRITVSGLAGGTYYLAVDGVGWGSPSAATPTGWTEYGSLGQYMIRGTYSAGAAGAQPVQITADRSALAVAEGGTGSVTLRATGATGDILVQLSGATPTVASLSASEVLLTAANDWTAAVAVAGLGNRDADGNKSFTLQAESGVAPAVPVAVTIQDDDVASATGGKPYGTYATAPGVANASTNTLRGDNGTTMVIREGMTADGAGIDFRWQFLKLAPGDKLLQIDAWSGVEAFRFEYSTDNAVTWKALEGAPASSLTWNGVWLMTGVGTSLWVRLLDTAVVGDTVRDTMTLDLLTLTAAPPVAMALKAEDWLLG